MIGGRPRGFWFSGGLVNRSGCNCSTCGPTTSFQRICGNPSGSGSVFEMLHLDVVVYERHFRSLVAGGLGVTCACYRGRCCGWVLLPRVSSHLAAFGERRTLTEPNYLEHWVAHLIEFVGHHLVQLGSAGTSTGTLDELLYFENVACTHQAILRTGPMWHFSCLRGRQLHTPPSLRFPLGGASRER